MIATLAFLLQFAGFACLAATMHATPATLRVAPAQRPLTARLGWSALTLSLATILLSTWPALALLTIAGTATVAAALVMAAVTIARPAARRHARAPDGRRLPRS